MAIDELSDSEKILNLGEKCTARAKIISTDGKKIHASYKHLKNYILNRLTMADIKATSALNELSTDILKKPDESIEQFCFRFRALVE